MHGRPNLRSYLALKSTPFSRLLAPLDPILLPLNKERLMSREIAKVDITAQLLSAKIEDAGYEVEVDDDGDISILKTGFNARIELFDEHSSLRFRAAIILNSKTRNSEIEALVAELNKRIFSPKFVYHRFDDGDLVLFSHYVHYVPFGLNMANLLFSLRRFLEGVNAAKEDFIKDTEFDPSFQEDAQRSLPAPEEVQ